MPPPRSLLLPSQVTFSPKVFIPLTRLCRDSCGYCTFAAPPRPGQRGYMVCERRVCGKPRVGQSASTLSQTLTAGSSSPLGRRP